MFCASSVGQRCLTPPQKQSSRCILSAQYYISKYSSRPNTLNGHLPVSPFTRKWPHSADQPSEAVTLTGGIAAFAEAATRSEKKSDSVLGFFFCCLFVLTERKTAKWPLKRATADIYMGSALCPLVRERSVDILSLISRSVESADGVRASDLLYFYQVQCSHFVPAPVRLLSFGSLRRVAPLLSSC